MSTLFLSDIHLEATPKGRERRDEFVQFLRSIDPGRVDRIVVLGDLFDFWFEYKHVVFSAYFEVLRAFADLHERGVALDLVCGNHDFWAGRFLEDELGFRVHRHPLLTEFGGRGALLLHGDGLNPADWKYRAYKRFARARWVIAAFRLIHPDWAMAIAQRVSSTGARLTQAEDLSAKDETLALEAYAKRLLTKGEVDVVICGHCHHPARMEFPAPNGTGLYLNTGDWMHHRSYIEWDGAEFHLRQLG